MADREIVRLNANWSLAVDPHQWVLRRFRGVRRTGPYAGEQKWEAVWFPRSKASLERGFRRFNVKPTPDARAAIDALPDTYSEWVWAQQRQPDAASAEAGPTVDVRLSCSKFGSETTKHRYRWNVTIDGDEVLIGSNDPEHDVARILLARGITGKVDILDGITGKVRTRIDVERASQWTVREASKKGLYLERVACLLNVGPGARSRRPAAVQGVPATPLPADTNAGSGSLGGHHRPHHP